MCVQLSFACVRVLVCAMGVHGLWRLLEATGHQVPLETLEGKVLAIDISIWIHQILQGYQDRFGNPKPNAHLIGLFNRICKLLYYRIKPVFVFDGGVPMLKKETTALRRKQKATAKNKAEQMRTELISNLIKHSAVKSVLSTENQNGSSGPSDALTNLQNKRTVDDIFKLPNVPSTSKLESSLSDEYESDSSEEPSPRKQSKWIGNIHNVDVTSAEFRALPADVRFEILTDIKETRKQNSWGRLHEMPEESHEFSGFQMKRLLKRRLVQESLETAEKEMGGRTLTLDELEKLLTEQGVTTGDANCGHRIAADSETRLIYIRDKNAYIQNSNANSESKEPTKKGMEAEETAAGSSKDTPIFDDINEYEFSDTWDSDMDMAPASNFEIPNETDSEAESETELNESRPFSKEYLGKDMNPAMAYMLEHSGFTEKQVIAFLKQSKREALKNRGGASEAMELIPKHIDNDSDNNSIDNDNQVEPVATVESICSPKEASIEISAEVDNNLPPCGMAVISKATLTESKDSTVYISTDSNSDSDGFIEIQDAPMLDFSSNVNKSVPPQGIQITFKTDEQVDDDMFADVFGTAHGKASAEITILETRLSPDQSEGRSPKYVPNYSNHEESRNHISLPETPVKSPKAPDEGKQSHSIIKLHDTDMQSSLKFDLDSKEASLTPQKNDTNRTVPNVAKSPTDDAEIAIIRDDINKNGPVDNAKTVANPIPMNEQDLLSLQTQLQDKQTELMASIGKLERQGIDISDQIRVEAQELLRLFGIPYVVAPMEAEAQCAYLEQLRLTDGTITDDSDIWLFGGQCVYKNFFDNNKKVLEFRSSDIIHHFKLTRNDMIKLALLVGSDYTAGLTGIGPVTALEILGAFPSEGDDLLQGLINFCTWIKSGRGAGPGRTALRNKLQKLEIRKGFPSQAVVQAYLFPKVDESKETFTWGKPNHILLSDYAKQKFGWDKDKYSKIMAPVLKRLEENKSHCRKISSYFKVQTIPKSIEMNMSKRIQKAVQKLGNEDVRNPASTEDDAPQKMKKTKSVNERRRIAGVKKNQPAGIDTDKSTDVSSHGEKYVEECIPQREKNKVNALKNKLHAIEVLRKSKSGLYKTKKVKRCVRKVKEQADLSESESSSS